MQSFTKTISNLKVIYDNDQIQLPNYFWNQIDKLPEQSLFVWVEKLLKIQGLLLGTDYVRVCGIQHDYRERGRYTEKQKRSIAIDLIKYWYDVEFISELG